MELSELAAYAREKYQIREQHKWADFPGFSVLAEPRTGKWAALLMRQWDSGTGTELQRCDIKCGRQCLSELHVPYLSLPFRMKGQNWAGVIFDRHTDPQVVYRLFDRAVASIAQQEYGRGPAIVLEELEHLRGNISMPGAPQGNSAKIYGETALPPRRDNSGKKPAFSSRGENTGRDEGLPRGSSRLYRDRSLLSAAEPAAGGRQPADIPGLEINRRDSAPPARAAEFFRPAGDLSSGRYSSTEVPQIPQKILQMMRLYEYKGDSIEAKSENFYRQGKFMEDYEDDAPWTGEYRRYFTTYHDLHLAQLRGYFTWRTAVRRGEYRPIPASFAYMYIYELLCGIGTGSPADGFEKMKAFESGFLDSGTGEPSIRRNLHKWMLDYAVLHGLPVETACLYEIPAVAERDRQLAALKAPEKHTDEEIFSALCAFGGKKLAQSPVIKEHQEKGKHLFASLWRCLTEHYRPKQEQTASRSDDTTENGSVPAAWKEDSAGKHMEASGPAADTGKNRAGTDSPIFTACFGERKSHPWHPLANAVYWEETKPQEAEYVLSECRTYRCHKGEWTEERYENPYFAQAQLQGLVHAADRGFRRYLKTGHYLRAKPEEAWAEPYIEAVIRADTEAEKEAARPKITIDLSGLEQIRRDALITRDSLLTKEEKEELEGTGGKTSPQEKPSAEVSAPQETLTANASAPQEKHSAEESAAAEKPLAEEESIPKETPPETAIASQEIPPAKAIASKEIPPAGQAEAAQVSLQESGLDALHLQILQALLRDQPAGELIRGGHLMPSIVADTINEAMFDEIGDNILDCDGDEIAIIEEYREDLEEILGEHIL